MLMCPVMAWLLLLLQTVGGIVSSREVGVGAECDLQPPMKHTSACLLPDRTVAVLGCGLWCGDYSHNSPSRIIK